MCGRFNVIDSPHVRALCSAAGISMLPQQVVNQHPDAPIEAVIESEGQRVLEVFRWRLRNSKCSDDKYASACARHDKLMGWYRTEFEHRRCLIIMSGWYEWYGPKNNRQARYMQLSGSACAVAGIWNRSNTDHGELLSAAIITIDPVESFRPYHHRMPLLLRPGQLDDWLAPNTDTQTLLSLVKARLPAALSITPVGDYVSRPANKDLAKCTEATGPVVILDAQ